MSQAAALSPSFVPPTRSPAGRLRPRDHLTRAIFSQLLAIARDQGEPATVIAARAWPNDDETQLVLRASSLPATPENPEWAGSFAGQAVSDFLASLPASAFASLRAASMFPSLTMPAAERLTVPSISDAPKASFVGSGGAIPVLQGQVVGATLRNRKVAAAIVMTRELLMTSNAEAVARSLLQASVTKGVDEVLLSNDAGTAIAPPGIFNGVVPIPADTGPDAMKTDLAALVGALPDATTPVIVAHLTQALALRLVFPQSGLEIVASPSMPPGSVAMIAAERFISVADGNAMFDLSEMATLVMADPGVPISSSGTPNAVAAPVRSLWQTGATGLRILLPIDWSIDPTSVALVERVSW